MMAYEGGGCLLAIPLASAKMGRTFYVVSVCGLQHVEANISLKQ